MVSILAHDRFAGDLVLGLGGIRKLRFAGRGRGRGKRGAFRVIDYAEALERPVLALLIYGKNEQANPTPEQRRAMSAVVAGFDSQNG